MNGQWIGEVTGTSSGEIIVNIDQRGSRYEGIAYTHESNAALPSSAAVFETQEACEELKGRNFDI
jgi:hypothetical protein